MKNINWRRLLIALFIPQVAGLLGVIFTAPEINSWYENLNKPFFNPPGWIFGPVWTVLYILMGISLYLVWQKRDSLGERIFDWWWIQLALNVLWSVIFFGWHLPLLALIEIGFLWWSIRKTMKSFVEVGRAPVRLLIPYLAWVSFAAILNTAIVWLNR